MKESLDIMFILKELYKISGFRITVHDTNFREIAAYPEEHLPFCQYIRQNEDAAKICRATDAEAFTVVNQTEDVYIYRCKFGLWEAVSPLYHFGVLAGYLMMGQVIDKTPESRKLVTSTARPFADDRAILDAKIDQIPVVGQDMIKSYVNIMTVCSEYITYSNKLRLPERDLAELTMKYIHRNYAQKLTIKELCVYFHCSKSTLINCFEARYHTSVNRYITAYRIEQASLLLRASDSTICEIALRCGFADQGYFSKVFQKEMNMTPTAYRQSFYKKDEQESQPEQDESSESDLQTAE